MLPNSFSMDNNLDSFNCHQYCDNVLANIPYRCLDYCVNNRKMMMTEYKPIIPNELLIIIISIFLTALITQWICRKFMRREKCDIVVTFFTTISFIVSTYLTTK